MEEMWWDKATSQPSKPFTFPTRLSLRQSRPNRATTKAETTYKPQIDVSLLKDLPTNQRKEKSFSHFF